MRWAERVDVETLNDAYGVWDALYRAGENPAVAFRTFFKRVLAAGCSDLSPEEVRALGITNVEAVRFSRTPFPRGNRVRPGDEDMRSVRHSMKRGTVASPIVLARTRTRGLLLLDGLHRIAAANLADRPLRACIVSLL